MLCCQVVLESMSPFISDYLQINLDEVNRLLQNDEHASDWGKFIKITIEMEGETIRVSLILKDESDY